MSEYLDSMDEIGRSLMDVTDKLNELSNAFYATGNPTMSDTLFDLSSMVNESRKHLNETISIESTKNLDESRKSLAETIGIVLTASLGKANEKK